MSTVLEAIDAPHAVVGRGQWLAARKLLLEKEKELTRREDHLAQLRRQLPWVKVEKPYRFETPCGVHPLSALFGDKSQLLVYHFMFGPDWSEGCPSCSMIGDQLNALAQHISQRDISLMLVSRAPLEKLLAFKTRMAWDNLHWASSAGCDFNADFGVALTEAQIKSGGFYNYGTQAFPMAEAPGLSAFVKQGGDVYHTYSTYGRGLEAVLGVYPLLDRAPRGRNESALPNPMSWVRHHDKYGPAQPASLASNAAAKSACGCH